MSKFKALPKNKVDVKEVKKKLQAIRSELLKDAVSKGVSKEMIDKVIII